MPSEFKPHKSQTIKSDERGVPLPQNHINELDGIANLDRHERILMANSQKQDRRFIIHSKRWQLRNNVTTFYGSLAD